MNGNDRRGFSRGASEHCRQCLDRVAGHIRSDPTVALLFGDLGDRITRSLRETEQTTSGLTRPRRKRDILDDRAVVEYLADRLHDLTGELPSVWRNAAMWNRELWDQTETADEAASAPSP